MMASSGQVRHGSVWSDRRGRLKENLEACKRGEGDEARVANQIFQNRGRK